jgi:hypothetical protein
MENKEEAPFKKEKFKDDNVKSDLKDDTENILNSVCILNEKVDNLNKNMMRIVYACLGIIAATLGVKLIGSPWWVDLFTFFACFSVVFLIGETIIDWKELSFGNKIFRIVYILFVSFSVISRIFFFNPINGTPLWFTPVIDSFFALLCIIIVLKAILGKNKDFWE